MWCNSWAGILKMAAHIAPQRSLPVIELRSHSKTSLGTAKPPCACSLTIDGHVTGWVLVLGENPDRYAILLRMFQEAVIDMQSTVPQAGPAVMAVTQQCGLYLVRC